VIVLVSGREKQLLKLNINKIVNNIK